MKIKFLGAFLLFLQNIENKCTQGCLKCTEDDKCLLCDSTLSYILSASTCVLS